MATAAAPYLRHRVPPEIIAHGVLLYRRFPLSLRSVEEMLLLRGVQVSHETIRRGCRTCGQQFAHELRRGRPKTGDKGHRDEVVLKINGQRYYLWRAVDHEGTVRAVLVQSRRNAAAAKRLMRKLMKELQCVPQVLITDTLKSDGAAHRELMPRVEHRQSKYLNDDRAENSHQPTRQRERTMQRFKSPGSDQRFLSKFSMISPHFRPRRHLFSAAVYRQEMHARLHTWREVTQTEAAG